MRALDRKLVRDLVGLALPLAAASLVMACGVALAVMSFTTHRSLEATRALHYRTLRFADVFVAVRQAPRSVLPRVAALPGVAHLEARLVREVMLDVPGLVEPAVGRLSSVPGCAARLALNRLHFHAGRDLVPGAADEVLASRAFAEANHLAPGDAIHAVLRGRLQRLRIVGVVTSPEHFFAIRPGGLLPDDRRYGLLWMDERAMASAFGIEAGFDDLAIALAPDAGEPAVLAGLDRMLRPWGGLGAQGRADQTSHRFLSDELMQLRAMGLTTPLIFLLVAAFILNVVLARLVALEREQVAALRAFGYTRARIARHYLAYGAVAAVVACVVGAAVGIRLARGLVAHYAQFFHFPSWVFALDGAVLAGACLVCVSAAVAGAVGAAWRAASLPPAEAMRPEAPARYAPALVEGTALGARLSIESRVALREVQRRPVRSFLSCVGLSFAVALLVLGRFTEDGVEALIDRQFHRAHRDDVSIAFTEPRSPRAMHAVRRLPGVVACEPARAVPVRIWSGAVNRRTALQALPPGSELVRLLDAEGRAVPLPAGGVVFDEALAQALGVAAGDVVEVEVLEARRPRRRVRITGIVREFAGLAAYAELSVLDRLAGPGPRVSGARITADGAHLDRLYTTLKATPEVAAVSLRAASLDAFRHTLAENIGRMRAFNFGFALILALGVVYNTARVALAERRRDIATLRVLGFRPREVTALVAEELAVLTALALAPGALLGRGLAELVMAGMQTETQRFPFVLRPSTHAFAIAVVAAATLACLAFLHRRIVRMELLTVLKAGE